MRELLPILITLVASAATVFLVFLLSRSLYDARRNRRQQLLEADHDTLIAAAEPLPPTTSVGRLDRGFDRLVVETGLGISPQQALGIMALAGVVLGGLPLLLRNDVTLAMIGLIAGVMLPLVFFLYQRVQYRWKVQSQLPDAFYLMARSMRAGLNLEQAMATVANYGTQPLASEFRRVVDQADLGLSIQAALQGMARRLKLSDFDVFVSAVTLHRTVGGNLAQLLERVASSARDRGQFRGYFRAATALARITGFAIAAAPLMLLIGYSIWQPEFVERFTTSTTGIRLLTIAGILEIIGIVWMYSLLRVEY
jgi:tight adherence protein B